MNIIKTQEGTTVTLKLEGRLDTNTSVDLEKTLDEVVPGMENLIFDFEELAYISSAGFRVLLGTKIANEESLNIKILHLQEEVVGLFAITGFDEIFTIE